MGNGKADDGGVWLSVREQLASMVAEHHAELYRYAYRLSGSAVEAEDLSQQTFLAAQAKIHQLRDRESGRSWLFTILRRVYLRNQKRRVPVPAASLQLEIDTIAVELPEADAFELNEIDREQLQAAVNELPTRFKLVLLMFYFEGCSYREIAGRLELPVGTVMSRLSRAKSHVRARLTPSAACAASDKTSGT